MLRSVIVQVIARKRSGVDNIEFPCENCGKIFIKNKYVKKKTCSSKCRVALVSRAALARSAVRKS